MGIRFPQRALLSSARMLRLYCPIAQARVTARQQLLPTEEEVKDHPLLLFLTTATKTAEGTQRLRKVHLSHRSPPMREPLAPWTRKTGMPILTRQVR